MSRHLVGALVAPLLLLSACATAGDDAVIAVKIGATAARSLRSAPDVAADAGTAAFEMVVSTSDGEEALELTTTGELDSDAGEIELSMDLSATWGGLAADGLPPGMDHTARVIVQDETIYLRLPMLDELTGTSGWLVAGPADVGEGQSAPSPGGSRGVFDPSALLEVLRGVTDDVETVGRDEVRGVPTTRYSATVRLADALDRAPSDRRRALQAQLEQLGVGDALIPVEAWIDRDGLARRVTMGFAGPSAAATDGSATVEISIELFDYGRPVSIEVPSPQEVTPYGDAMAAMAQAFLEAGA